RMLVPDGTEWRTEVNAGVALQVLSDRPGLDAGRIRCPLFVAVCENDVVTPPEPAAAAAAAAPLGELHAYPFTHFEAYVGAGFEELCADETAFLRKHLLG
ncbi:MAG: alpha/beta hydrolase, partial [Sporichthyaceae bacterium]